MADDQWSRQSNPAEGERLGGEIGALDARQVAIWRQMSPARRLELAFQAYQFALEMVRVTERRRHPESSPEELARRVVQRMHGARALADRGPR